MRRTGFKPRATAPREKAQRALLAPPARSNVSASMAPVAAVFRAFPKGEKARSGKRSATVEEARWLEWIVGYGCIACRLDGFAPRPTAVHHLLRGGVRMGHLHSLPLCDPGHHQGGESLGLVSRHPTKARFEARYGTEASLLAMLRAEYARQLRNG